MPNLHNEHEYIQDFIKARGLYLVHVLYIFEAFFEVSEEMSKQGCMQVLNGKSSIEFSKRYVSSNNGKAKKCFPLL